MTQQFSGGVKRSEIQRQSPPNLRLSSQYNKCPTLILVKSRLKVVASAPYMLG